VTSRAARWALALILVYGALLRIDRLLSNPDFNHPDSLRHFLAAEDIHLKEPSSWFAVYRGYLPYALYNRVLFGLTSHRPEIQRFGTVLLSVGLIGIVGWCARKRCGDWGGVFAAYLVASSPILIASSDSGIREDLYACLWVLLFDQLFHLPAGNRRAWGHGIRVGGLAMLVFLTRVDACLALGVMGGLALISRSEWREPERVFPALAVFFLLLLVVLPANWMRKKDPFYFVDKDKKTFRYWANMEFKGQPGFPSIEEVDNNLRVGEPISAWTYFGSILGWEETARRFGRGYLHFLVKNFMTGVYRLDALPNQVGIVGLLTMLGIALEFYRRRWELPLAPFVLLAGTIWTYNIPGGRDLRFYQAAIPFAVLLATTAACQMMQWILSLKGKWLRIPLLSLLPVLVVANPWNHDLKTSFPWRVGPTSDPIQLAGRFPLEFGPSLRLKGYELRRIGPLGLWTIPSEEIAPGQRFLLRLFWSCRKEIPEAGEYHAFLEQDGLGRFGMMRPFSLIGKFPVNHWPRGLHIVDEIEYLVYKGVPAGTTRIRVGVKGGGLPGALEHELTVFTLKKKSGIFFP